MKYQTKELQSKISANTALELLINGNKRFVDKKFSKKDYFLQISKSTSGQYPFAIILSCIDSRVPPEIIFDKGIGDIFSVRVAGNVVSSDVLGSIEYACKYAGVKLILVLGHTSCGAVKGACDNLKDGNLSGLLEKIDPAVKITKTDSNEKRNSSNIEFVNKVAENNTKISIDNILAKSSILKKLYNSKNIKIKRAIYDVNNGKVSLLN
ncbi:MAG: carbonic anhydrase [Flavobacteriaceae bacterium]|nr:carbonic anhydrase [Flavobacteriaceae bacterium]